MSNILKKIQHELGLLFFSGCFGLIPYLIMATILSIFKDGPAYDHWLPLSMCLLISLLVWFFSYLEMR